MSATNGTGHKSANAFIRHRRAAAGYRPYAMGGTGYANSLIDGKPLWNWAWADRMRRDQKIDLALRILRAPLGRVKWKIRTDRSDVGEFVHATLQRIWTRCRRQIAKGLHIYGVHGGEFSYKIERGLIQFDKLDDFYPRDIRPLEFKSGRHRGKIAGLELLNSTADVDGIRRMDGVPAILAPHAWWFAGDNEYGMHHGRARIAGAFEPYLEKRGRNGAVDARRLYFRKCGFKGPRMRHPLGYTDFGEGGTPDLRSNQDVARQIAERYDAGGIVVLPNIPNASERMDGEYAWIWEDPEPLGQQPEMLEYLQQLDVEMLEGMGILPEIVQAAEPGSGYSGRSLPFMQFFTMVDEDAGLIINAADSQCIRGLVRENFGKASYEIEPQSLLEEVKAEPDKARDMLKGGDDEGQPTQLSHESDRPRLAERIRTLAEQDFADLGPIQLSWSAEKTSRGTIKAVGSGEHSGKVLYGEAAKKALSDKQEKAAKPTPAKKGERPTVETTVQHVAKLRENFTIEGLGHLAHILQQHTVAEMGQIKAALGIKVSGSKVELAKKIAQRALADMEKPKEDEKPKAAEKVKEPKAAKPAPAASPQAEKLRAHWQTMVNNLDPAVIDPVIPEMHKGLEEAYKTMTGPQFSAFIASVFDFKLHAKTKAELLRKAKDKVEGLSASRNQTWNIG